MSHSLTICEYLEQGDAQVKFYDMGRRVVEISHEDMQRFEAAEIPYPQPFLQFAWIGILFTYPDVTSHNEASIAENNPDSTSPHNIWFVKLPLDEKGLLQLAARDDFLRHIIKTVDESLAASLDNNNQHPALDDNPHGFTPREDRMAVFHANISKKLGDEPSQYFAHALDYLSGTAGYEQWNFVGLQGLADVVARMDENDNAAKIDKAISLIPATPYAALCSCLENYPIKEKLAQKIAGRVINDIDINDTVAITAGIRGISHSSNRDTVLTTINAVLNSPAGHNIEVLASIAGRAWESLEHSEQRLLFLENLAMSDNGQQAFNAILTDLLFLPGMRDLIKEDFTNPACSEQLTTAIDNFLQYAKTL